MVLGANTNMYIPKKKTTKVISRPAVGGIGMER